MKNWSQQLQEELTLLIKDWLKNQSKTQADLATSLQCSSSRMPILLEVLKKDYRSGGIVQIAKRLCSIESDWNNPKADLQEKQASSDPFNQLDLLLEKLREDTKK